MSGWPRTAEKGVDDDLRRQANGVQRGASNSVISRGWVWYGMGHG